MQTAPSTQGQHIPGPDFASILENVTDAVAVVDPDWTIVYLNGLRPPWLAGPRNRSSDERCGTFSRSCPSTEAQAQLQHAMRAGEQVRFEHFHESGRRWYDVHAEPADGGLILFVRDVTDLKCYQRLFETTQEGILIVDAEGRYVDVNESYCRILKTTRERLIGALFSQFIPYSASQCLAYRDWRTIPASVRQLIPPLETAFASINVSDAGRRRIRPFSAHRR